MRIYRNLLLCIALCFSLSVVSCKHKVKQESASLQSVALPCHISCHNFLSDSAAVFPEEFEGILYRLLKQGEGKRADLRIPYPDSWQLEAALESPFPGIDIWIVSNSGDVSYKLLLTLSVPREEGETQEVIDGLWLAYSAANEQVNRIESEEWVADIDEEMNISVQKKYEVLYSMSDTTHTEQDNFLKECTDVFHVDYNGFISYEEPQPTENYKAIIQFMDTAEAGLSVDDDWVKNTMIMQENLESYGIYFIEVFQHFDEVLITNYHGEPVDVVNISSFLKTYGRGYILVEKGKKPKYVRYGSAVNCLRRAFPMWDLNPELIRFEEDNEESEEDETVLI